MCNNSTESKDPISFWRFLCKHPIRIPIIQRDYAQGREDEKEKRQGFLKDLKNTLSSEDALLPLYFVYGSYKEIDHNDKDNTRNEVFEPIDGQQRLTTLWLLHWYIAYKACKLENDSSVKSTLQKFSYATRVSAREFCKKLCELPPLVESNLRTHIQNQNWFFSSWNQDPTIQAMLRMLENPSKQKQSKKEEDNDNIVEVFSELKQNDFEIFWERLIETKCINFRVLDISEIGQTDDLYVKMNARGKPLTSFENFKAQLVNYIEKQAEKENNQDYEAWKTLNDPENGFAQKLDNAWTDLFWILRSNDKSSNPKSNPEHQNHIDEIFFAFFNRFFFNFYAINADSNPNIQNDWRKHPLYSQNDTSLGFVRFERYQDNSGSIPLVLFQEFEKVLDRLIIFLNTLNTLYYSEANLNAISINVFNSIIKPSWDNVSMPFFLPEYLKPQGELDIQDDENQNRILKITKIDVKSRAVFYTICRWFIENKPNQRIPDKQEDNLLYSSRQITFFKDWMRFVWNIVENSDVDDNLPGGLKLLKELSPYSSNILSFLASRKSDGDKVIEIQSRFASDQLLEECQKAKQIMGWRGNHGWKDEAWYYRIKEAEKSAFFHGCIRFLYTGEEKKQLDWKDFNTKFTNSKLFFDSTGVKLPFSHDAILMRAFLSRIKDFNLFWQLTFTPVNSGKETWMVILKNSSFAPAIHNLLKEGSINKHKEWLSHPECKNADNRQKRVVEDLVTTSVLAKTNVPTIKLKDNGHYSLRRKGSWSYYFIAEPRYVLLANAILQEKIQCQEHTPGTQSFRGSSNANIYFSYKDSRFEWWGNPNQNETDVYLLKPPNGPEEPRKPPLKESQLDLDNYYCVAIPQDTTVEEFCSILDKLIEDYQKAHNQQ